MALGPEDISAASNALKVIYTDDELQLYLSQKHAFFAAIKKSDSFEGKRIDHDIQHGYNQSAGPSIAAASATNSTATDALFSVLRKQYYGYGQIDREVILASRSQKGSFTRKLKQAYDNSLMSLERFLKWTIWGNGGGSYGTLAGVGVASGLLNTQVQVTNIATAPWIEKDMKLQFSVNSGFGNVTTVKQPGGGAEGAATTGITLTVANINRRTGVITFTAAVPVAAGEVAVGDYFFRYLTKGQCVDGVRAWVPMNDTDAALAFNGVPRSVDIERLAGLRYLTPEATYGQTILAASAYASNVGSQMTSVYMNPVSIQKMGEIERSRVVREEIGDLEIGFNAIKFATSVGDLSLMAEATVPPGWAFITDPSFWEFRHLDTMVGFFEEDGLLKRVDGFDRYEFRLGGYGNLLCHAPQQSMWVKLDSAAVEI